ncbi:MAG: hypothetical protein JWO05_160 [Gemmatimonadetes bacterium]|nr:hypothetical protein [Gemmatimonadota bacterium]
MTRPQRVLVAILGSIAGLVVLGLLAVFVLSSTQWGHDKVRQVALNALRGSIHGQVTIGSVSGNLLTGATLHDVAIRDSSGAPFLVVRELGARYGLRGLLGHQLDLRNVTLVEPLLVLDKSPTRGWNYKRLFASDSTRPSSGGGFSFTTIRLRDVVVTRGHVVVRTLWHPDTSLSATARDSSVRDALGGGTRLMVVQVAGGFQKVVEMKDINARLPLVSLKDPAQKSRLIDVASLNMQALPFRPPAAVVSDLKGRFAFNDDSLWWGTVNVAMPASKMNGSGRYAFNSGDMTLRTRGAPAAFADFRWLYPRLPSSGGGPLELALDWKGTTDSYVVRNADLRTEGARAQGDFGMTRGDTTYFHGVNVRVTNLDTRLVEQLAPGLKAPRRGALTGRVALNGSVHAMRVDTDIGFQDARAGYNRLVAVGGIGFNNGSMQARALRFRLAPLQVALVKAYMPSLPIGGTISGTGVLQGDSKRSLVADADIMHDEEGAHSRLTGRGEVRLAGAGTSPWFDVNVRARPLSLVTVGRFAPAVGLRGFAAGPIRITGTTRAMAVRSDLATSDGGRLAVNGSLGVAGKATSYDLVADARLFNASTVLTKAPRTSLTARISAQGTGFSAATARATIAADLATSSWDSLAVDTASVRVSVADGLARIERAYVRGGHATLDASGAVGLVAARSGTLSFRASVDSLGAFNRFLPRTAADTGTIAPRKGLVARLTRKARSDSVKESNATQIERLAAGKAAPRLNLNVPAAVRRDTLSGSLLAAGTLTGSIERFDLRARVGAENLVARGNSVKQLRAEVAWNAARTPNSQLVIGAKADSVSAYGFVFDTADVRLAYGQRAGHVEAVVRQGKEKDYALKGDFSLSPDHNEVRIADATLRFDTTTWRSVQPAAIRWSAAGIEVKTLDFRNASNGRIYVDGLLPKQGRASLVLAVDNLDVDNVLDLAEADLPLVGLITARVTFEGTMSDPRFKGGVGLVRGRYNGADLPDLRASFDYASQQLVAHTDLLRGTSAPFATAEGTIPINLAFSGVTGSRMLDAPMQLTLNADSLPLDLVPQFVSQLDEFSGRAAGRVAMRGTFKRPSLAGALTLSQGHLKLAATGMAINDMVASLRMANDTVYVDSLAGFSNGPVRVTGSLSVGDWRTPGFNLFLIASDAEVLNNARGRVYANAGLALKGPFNDAYLSGQVEIRHGVAYAPEPTGKRLVSAGDPAIFNVVDTAVASTQLFPAQSPLLKNLRMDVDMAIDRGTWVRTKDANIEVFSDGRINVHVEQQALAMTGVVATDRGEYTFLSKRFQIKRGSATFIGGPELNPTLQVTGEYEVALAAAPSFNIRVLIGGTLSKPRVSLESDAQPPISQSDLLSYLAFGRSSSSLLQLEGSSLSGPSTGGNLVGYGASLAVRRMAAVALGIAADEVQGEASKAVGADVFNITPADVPTEFGGKGITAFLAGTKVEAGKYINTRTFLGVQATELTPGFSIQYRTPKGWRYEASMEPRYLLREPTLQSQILPKTMSYGAFIIREWRF